MRQPKATTPLNSKGTTHGGPRPNSGRPPASNTASRDGWDARLSEAIGGRADELLEGLIRLALGVHVERELEGGSTVVYQLPPDYRAATYLLDRIAGKPKQAVAVDSDRIDMRAAVAMTQAASNAYLDPDDEAVA